MAVAINSVCRKTLGPDAIISGSHLAEFSLFPRLVVELRLRVWSFAFTLQSPRIVEVRTLHHDCTDSSYACHRNKTFCPRFSPSRGPILLRVCHEARMVALEEALRAGNLCFFNPRPDPWAPLPPYASIGGCIFFNPQTDRLYLPLEKPWVAMAPLDPDGSLAPPQARMPATRPRGPAGLHPLANLLPTADDTTAQQGIPRHPESTLSQFKKAHQPLRVRLYATDLDLSAAHHAGEDYVWEVMKIFSNVEDLIFVVLEHIFAYADFIAELEHLTEELRLERERHGNALAQGVVEWKWPRVRLAVRCFGGFNFVELAVQL